jgi:hypothetical protein
MTAWMGHGAFYLEDAKSQQRESRPGFALLAFVPTTDD